MSEHVVRELTKYMQATSGTDGAALMRMALKRIYELEEQLAEKDRQIETWEIAAQKWVQQVDELCRRLDERAPPPLKKAGLWWMKGGKA